MRYRNLGECVADLESSGRLKRITCPLKTDQEVAAVQRRALQKSAGQAGGPALLFMHAVNPDGRITVPLLGNLFGSKERARYIFRSALAGVESLFKITADPLSALRHPLEALALPRTLWHMLPRKVKNGPIMEGQTRLSALPQIKSWPLDGGGYVTLPQVYTENPSRPGFFASNTGMYRVQLSGGNYAPDTEAGLHYQIHRGIGYHHAEAIRRGERLKVNIFVGGPPALSLAAVLPLPEGVPEICFAGALGGRRIAMLCRPGVLPMPAEADFCISGSVGGNEQGLDVKPEGPFGDHLGYYSLAHDFPLLKVEAVHCRPGAIWPFTTVGRPPQEDTVFGEFIHELTRPLIPKVFSGVHEVHAVDAAGVHPLLLALGSERYVPFAKERQPQELLSCGLALLGSSQTSLSKYLLLAAQEDAPALSTRNVPDFFRHMLERTDFSRDLHFITRTTMDTLDYTGISLNQGSKLLWVAAGQPKRELCLELPADLRLSNGFNAARLFAPGLAVCQGPQNNCGRDMADTAAAALADDLNHQKLSGLALLVLADDAAFCAENWSNFLWVLFTRSDPATDIYGVGAFNHNKHWGCTGPLIIDARARPFHSSPLEEDPAVVRRIEELGVKGGPLYGII